MGSYSVHRERFAMRQKEKDELEIESRLDRESITLVF